MKRYLQKLIDKKSLSRIESQDVFARFSVAPVEQQAAVMALFAAKKIEVSELLGARDFLMTQSTHIDSPYEVIDIVGTGGDGIGTFNISTAASLLVASCGVYVAKHGGKSVTSQSGSADVMEHLQIMPSQTAIEAIQNLRETQYVYLQAPVFNQALRQYRDFRKNLSFPSLFNILGPLVNPMRPKRQVIGVYHRTLLRTVAEVLQEAGSQHALILHSEEGLDEISVSSPTHIVELKQSQIHEYTIKPNAVGLPISSIDTVLGGMPADNAKMILGIASGQIVGPKRDVVLFNSAAGLLVAGKVSTLKEGVEFSREALFSGKMLTLINQLQSRGQA